MSLSPCVIEKAKKIKLLILDVDGVLTDGSIWFSPDGVEYKSFNCQDGLGLKRLQKMTGVDIAVISGRSSKCVEYRMQNLGIEHSFLGYTDKQPIFEKLLSTLNFNRSEVAYVGDDLPDLAIMQLIELPIAVNNAVDSVKNSAVYVTQQSGGHGAVREVCDLLIMAQT